MEVKRIGTVKERLDGKFDLMYWEIDNCDYPPTEAEMQQLVTLAKENGTYSFEGDDIPLGVPFA